jgi:hypothetical protein
MNVIISYCNLNKKKKWLRTYRWVIELAIEGSIEASSSRSKDNEGCGCLIIVIILLIVGGWFFTMYFEKKKFFKRF